ncbi:MAG: class I SAM-dependent methyltransferase [Candidatus Nanopelagicales bacterium]
MTHDHSMDPAEMLGQDFWDERYRSSQKLWSGNPNPQLVDRLTGITPGDALDVGCGEGADAIWLAAQGWQVTGADVSQVALDRAAAHAREAGQRAATSWQRVDVLTWQPPLQAYDLVTASFLHLPSAVRDDVHRRLATAVRPGGRLLVVAHHVSDLHTKMRRPDMPDMFFTAEQVAAVLSAQDWDIREAAAPERSAIDPDGQATTVRDTVLLAVRR